MNILALDTATERCSVALLLGERVIERSVETPRGHADLILPMVEAVLKEGAVELRAVDAIAYGRGPGAFTGVRIAVGVAQGLAFGAGVPTIGVSDLAAVAFQAGAPCEDVLVCMDARMNEVYWACFERDAERLRVLARAVLPRRRLAEVLPGREIPGGRALRGRVRRRVRGVVRV